MMRGLKIPHQIIIDDFSVEKKYLWECWNEGFESMFAYKYGEDPDDVEIFSDIEQNKSEKQENGKNHFIAEVLYPPQKQFDWDWYSPITLSNYESSDEQEEYYYHKKIKNWLDSFVNHNKNILTIHGRTGVGKTTLLRHFFNHYLPQKCINPPINLHCIRLSIPLIALDIRRMEEDIDHKIYNYLINMFTEGKYNLHDPKILVQLCLSEFPNENRENDIKYFNDNPPPSSTPAQLLWFRKIGLGREISGKSNNVVSPWADFNRLSIQYLTSNGIILIIILDNIDQLPAQHQLHTWNIIRSKLDWINNKKNIAYIISFRSYLLENAYSLGGIQAYSGKTKELLITPPKLYDILCRRKNKYFDKYHKNKSTKLDYGQHGITVKDPSAFMDKFLSVFSETDIRVSIAKLANFNLRTAFEIAKCIFQYPYYSKEIIEEANKYVMTVKGADSSKIITLPRIIDSIVKKGNKICDVSTPIFDNLYYTCQSNHFSNTLAKIYILKILQNDKQIEDLKKILNSFLHDKIVILKAIHSCLQNSILTSPQGNDLENNKIRILSLSDSSYGEVYLNNLFYDLYYIQAMAYRTYFDTDIIRKFESPKKIDEDDTLISKRLMAALTVVEQFCKDEREQKDLLKSRAKISVQNLFVDLSLSNLGRDLYDKVHSQLDRLFKSINRKVFSEVISYENNIYKEYLKIS